ncbi:MAG TPA: hypothetical protein VN697_09130 [Tepidiformaceae bacterium]|jgi:hypothetical protein|nr:hypothetical protein [Tepidiformaceae bacterium]
MFCFVPVFLADEILHKWPWDTLLAIAVVGTVALVPIAVAIGSSYQRKRTEQLREEFGPDYDIALNEHGDWRLAERELMERRKKRRHSTGPQE